MKKIIPYIAATILWSVLSIWICFRVHQYWYALLLIGIGLIPLLWELFYKSKNGQANLTNIESKKISKTPKEKITKKNSINNDKKDALKNLWELGSESQFKSLKIGNGPEISGTPYLSNLLGVKSGLKSLLDRKSKGEEIDISNEAFDLFTRSLVAIASGLQMNQFKFEEYIDVVNILEVSYNKYILPVINEIINSSKSSQQINISIFKKQLSNASLQKYDGPHIDGSLQPLIDFINSYI